MGRPKITVVGAGNVGGTVAQRLADVGTRVERVQIEAQNRYRLAIDRFGPVRAAGYMARFYLDCELLIVGRD